MPGDGVTAQPAVKNGRGATLDDAGGVPCRPPPKEKRAVGLSFDDAQHHADCTQNSNLTGCMALSDNIWHRRQWLVKQLEAPEKGARVRCEGATQVLEACMSIVSTHQHHEDKHTLHPSVSISMWHLPPHNLAATQSQAPVFVYASLNVCIIQTKTKCPAHVKAKP